MKRKATILLTTLLAVGVAAGQALSATVCGVAQNAQGNPVGGATVTVKDPSGKTLGQATTGNDGQYSIRGLTQGSLDLFLEPGSGGGHPGSGVLNLSGESERVNWQVSDAKDAIASEGGSCLDPGGLTSAEWASIGVLALGAGAGIGAIVWATTGDRRDHKHPASPLF